MVLEIIQGQSTTINDDVQFDSVTAQLDANDEPINSVGTPVENDDAATKQYVDDNISGVTTGFLKADGTIPMTGVLLMNDNRIVDVLAPISNSGVAVNSQIINLQDQIDDNTTDITNIQLDKLNKDGSIAMIGDLDLGTNNLDNVGSITTNNIALNNSKVLLGTGAANGAFDISIGNGALSSGTTQQDKIGIGTNAGRVGRQYSIYIGRDSGFQNSGSDLASVNIGLGAGKLARHQYTVCLGRDTTARAPNSIAIGHNANITSSGHGNSICIGNGCVSSAVDQINLKAGVNELRADTTGLTYNSNNIEGDFKANGSIAMTSDLDAGTNNIINVVDPINPQDASTKKYVDDNIQNVNTIVPDGQNLQVYGGAYIGSLTHRRPVMSGGWTQTLQGAEVSNTIVTTSILGTGIGSLTVPANAMKQGSTSHSVLGGTIQTQGNTRTITFAMYSGGTQLFTKTFLLAQTLAPLSGWKLEVDITCAGVSGLPGLTSPIFTLGTLTFGNDTGESDVRTIFTPSLIDTTIPNVFDVRVTWLTAELNNKIQCYQAYTYNIFQPL